MKICPVGVELFHEGGQADWHEETTAAFRSFPKDPENGR